MIISIIVVLCIAAAVAAYGLTNSDNPIFSDLSSMGSNDNSGNGAGNITAHNATNPSSSGSSSSGSSGTGTGTSSNGGSGNGGGSHNGGGSNGGGSSSGTRLSQATAQSIANGAVGEPGYYAGTVSYSNGYWYFAVYDANGTQVDSIAINDATGMTERV